MKTPIALHSVAHRVSHQIPAESEMSRQDRATPPPPPNQGIAPFSGPPCRTFLSFAAGRGRGGLAEGIAALLGSEDGSRYRGVSQLQSHQSRYSVQLRRTLAIQIAVITLASASAITIAQFRPSKCFSNRALVKANFWAPPCLYK